ncbi:tRNA lysidine(34) synthetase TilS [Solemya pervernicosa gill symbiont]|uniref:tRNA(Ile)-lysidine synthase n=2 Tax=Gammaproteobacteria incertae sedis TaxID=118884 RepID=A0A1T2L7W5_9GAMM|nr:tRNA lysidine(34) synthetase TilS [Candidatus Reidiella endopervernicosa]OOZ41197.1 tRNA lysidine(34) synthetase TilS [Solemya pervernicosa gill symbiont]QKQ27078.1 tRNA lysidine(34) synthetase TilS [Candidatus Reidiella endopervernicosa]
MELTPAALQHFLKQTAGTHRYWIALSGGIDSSVLLHLLSQCSSEMAASSLRAVHIDHQLQPESSGWGVMCRDMASSLGVEYHEIKVEAHASKGESPEAAARNARYATLESLIEPGDLLLTAHHQEDQAETLMLQLMRGAGPKGLASMPTTTPFGRGELFRPLLEFSRAELEAYAAKHQLSWIDDPSNGDTGFDRNYLRHEIMPLLQRRWPAVARTVSRSASNCAEASDLLDQLAELDLQGVQRRDTLLVSELNRLSDSRQRNLIRFWVASHHLPLPDSRRLDAIMQQLLPAKEDAMPLVKWRGAEVRRYQGRLYLMQPLAEAPDRALSLVWHQESVIELPQSLGTLQIQKVTGEGVAVAHLERCELSVSFRRGGEYCKISGHAHHRKLKQLLQELGVPPWQRGRIPLIYLDNELAAIGDRWICEPFQAQVGESGGKIVWNSPF